MNDVTTIPAPYAHQKITTDFITNTKTCLITSDPGTGNIPMDMIECITDTPLGLDRKEIGIT